ncbi:V-type ATP synthase subunit I [Candidatus Peregrinibacteria bacterium]|nr:V-type ATP synthase subunit I [Candidatus Peregrinibacteria bacterium]
MQKINLFVTKKDKKKVMSFLQDKGVLHLTGVSVEEPLESMGHDDESHELQYKVAELDFAIKFLSGFEKKKKSLQAIVDGDSVKVSSKSDLEEVVTGFSYDELIERCKSVESEMNSLANEVKDLNDTRERLAPWSSYNDSLSVPCETNTAAATFAILPLKTWKEFRDKVVSLSDLVVVEFDSVVLEHVYCKIVCEKSFITAVEGEVVTMKGEVVELPALEGTVKEELRKIEKRLSEISDRRDQLKKASVALSKDLPKLRMIYDFFNWKLIQKNARQLFKTTDSTVVIAGWMPKASLAPVRNGIEEITPAYELLEVEPDENESAPVLLHNSNFMRPFQSVTSIYGLPLPNELDPTPYLAFFFIVFFGLALTDAIYGLLMFVSIFTFLRYIKIPKASQGLLRLLMYAGIVTFFAGALYGGWGSLDVSQVPSWMTTVNADGEKAFFAQKINAITNPMGVLILSLILGYIQVLFGVIINFAHKFRTVSKKEAMIDSFPWVFILTVIAFMIMVKAGILPESIGSGIQYLLYVAIALVVLTQGREKKNPIMKLVSGILALYGLVGYLSDILSYSRLLALGLATSIIGLAVNTIAGMVNGVPIIGIVLAIIVLIGGHAFNLGINALGAFIHSGRLQFVEFFTKFLEGGGKSFKPFEKESRFVRFAEK